MLTRLLSLTLVLSLTSSCATKRHPTLLAPQSLHVEGIIDADVADSTLDHPVAPVPASPRPHMSHRTKALVIGLGVGVGAGLVIGLVTRRGCPHRIDGVAYDGTPPCPKYWPDPPSKGEPKP